MKLINLTEKEIKEIFNIAYTTLKEMNVGIDVEIQKRRNRTFNANLPDSHFYKILVRDTLGGGKKAKFVEKEMRDIEKAFADFNIEKVSEYSENDLNDLRFVKRKINDSIQNARVMKEISKKYGSFGQYLKSQYEENLDEMALASELEQFGSVRLPIALNFLKDIGIDAIKPDTHIFRVLYRLGLLDSEKNKKNIYKVRKLAELMKPTPSEKLSIIDAVLWKYGMEVCKADKDKPLCNKCHLKTHCRKYSKKEKRSNKN